MVKDDGESGRYSALPHAVLFDTRLSPGARVLYAVMQSHWWQGGECWASHLTLAAQVGCKDRMLRYYIRELIERGYVTERRRGHGQAKAYAPVESASQAATDCQLNRQEIASSRPKRQPVASQAATDCQFKRQPVADRNKQREEDTSGRKNTMASAASAADQPAEGAPKARRPRGTRCPETFPLEDKHFTYGETLGLDRARVAAETEKFLAHHRFKGTLGLDWYAGWQNWMRKAVEYGASRPAASHRNGVGPAPAGGSALREQTRQHSKWSDPHWDRVMGGAAQRGGPQHKRQDDGR